MSYSEMRSAYEVTTEKRGKGGNWEIIIGKGSDFYHFRVWPNNSPLESDKNIFLDTRPFFVHFLKKMFFAPRKAENTFKNSQNC